MSSGGRTPIYYSRPTDPPWQDPKGGKRSLSHGGHGNDKGGSSSGENSGNTGGNTGGGGGGGGNKKK
ncbi:hypothetical protein COL26b_013522 [Colletotrichum chrysophilum]|uniref:uncharacterized protein n=1 Tax=Colletotrichum chrysophilum TaxID=1836956 RepID=UPI002300F29D|nr:uncharacterized protein COL26b_013522 [Colletotrichum chrysophilum]KAJ0361942.1 hypothetical protein COL26b_013522 [Colletotrichum chrysophilum]